MNGKEYEASNLICPVSKSSTNFGWEDISDGEASVVYNLNLDYSTLSGVLYVPYSSLSCPLDWSTSSGVTGDRDVTESTISVKIYGDDILLFEAPTITNKTYDPISFDIDVAGIRNLKITMRGVWGKFGYPVTYHSKVCMADVMLQK